MPRLGEEADAERIHYRKLTMRYHDVLATSPVEIFYCGSLEGKAVARILTDVLSTMPRGEIDEDIGTDIRMNALEEQPRYVTETLPVAQGAARRGLPAGRVHGRAGHSGAVCLQRALRRLRHIQALFECAREAQPVLLRRLAPEHAQGAADRDERHRRKKLRARTRRDHGAARRRAHRRLYGR